MGKTLDKFTGALGKAESAIKAPLQALGLVGHPSESKETLTYAEPEQEAARKRILAEMMQILFGPARPTEQITPAMMGLSALQRGPSTLPANFQPYQIGPPLAPMPGPAPALPPPLPLLPAPIGSQIVGPPAPGIATALPITPQSESQLRGLALPQAAQLQGPPSPTNPGMQTLRGLSIPMEGIRR